MVADKSGHYHRHIVGGEVDQLVDGAGRIVGDISQRVAEVALRVKIDEQHTLAQLGQGCAQIDGGGRLSDAALLIADGDDLHVFCLLFVFIFCSEIVVRQGCAPAGSEVNRHLASCSRVPDMV